MKLTEWIATTRAVDLPHLHSLTSGLRSDQSTVDSALVCLTTTGRTEGINTRTNRITRQMHRRAGFGLLRHRILLP